MTTQLSAAPVGGRSGQTERAPVNPRAGGRPRHVPQDWRTSATFPHLPDQPNSTLLHALIDEIPKRLPDDVTRFLTRVSIASASISLREESAALLRKYPSKS